MKILVFEWLTCGGLWHDRLPVDLNDSMQIQGRQMLQAITTDFLAGGVEVILPIDRRLFCEVEDAAGLQKRGLGEFDDLKSTLIEFAAQVDFVMLIAPESESCLTHCLDWLKSFSAKLISPDIAFSTIASSKPATLEHLRLNGFDSVPQGINFGSFRAESFNQFRPPAVLKPIEGAGSEEVRLITDWMNWQPEISRFSDQYWLEEFVSGIPVSVSVLCGPGGCHFLPPTRQLFDRVPFGNYVGAGFPLETDLTERATRLARTAIKAMPKTRGYVGIDLVLSDREDRTDCLIEINPRLTMSYLKLRDVCQENLATLMLNIAAGITAVSRS